MLNVDMKTFVLTNLSNNMRNWNALGGPTMQDLTHSVV